MGIDIYMKWDGMPEIDRPWQTDFYLQEGYGRSPYPTRLLLPEAFDESLWSRNGVPIPASLMRERLTSLCEPFGQSGGHKMVANIVSRLGGGPVPQEDLRSMSVEDAIRAKYADYPDAIESRIEQYRRFVAAAERIEQQTGRPVRILASW